MLNEAGNVNHVLHELLDCFEPGAIRVVCVDDGSTDATSELVQRVSAQNPWVELRTHPRRRGYGAAIATGLEGSATRIVGWMDGDGQYDPRDLLVLQHHVIDGAAAAIGTRIDRADASWRRVLGMAGTALARRITSVALEDADAGIKLFDTDRVDLDGLRSTGSYVSTEAVGRASRVGRIDQVPVNHRPRHSGHQTGASPRVLAGLVADFVRCEISRS